MTQNSRSIHKEFPFKIKSCKVLEGPISITKQKSQLNEFVNTKEDSKIEYFRMNGSLKTSAPLPSFASTFTINNDSLSQFPKPKLFALPQNLNNYLPINFFFLFPFLIDSKFPNKLLMNENNSPMNKDIINIVTQKNKKGGKLLYGKAYESRNVYKSIVRFLSVYTNKNSTDIIRILKEARFKDNDIEKCFLKMKKYGEISKSQISQKNFQFLIKKIVMNLSPHTYVLRETLQAIMINCFI